MTTYALEVTLKSALHTGGGVRRSGMLDNDIAFDELGLPILPGRRLKGLWRDACRDLQDALGLCRTGSGLAEIETLFGAGGRPIDETSLVQVSDGHLKDWDDVRDWLRYLLDERGLTPDEITETFCEVRPQTSVARETGTAAENTLRFTRVLASTNPLTNQAHKFLAPVRLRREPAPQELTALALAAAAVQHMGLSRTRGLGEVRWRLLAWENGKERDLTDEAQADFDKEHSLEPEPRRTTLPDEAQTPSDEQSAPSVPQQPPAPTHLLRYRLTLQADSVLPSLEGDPNTVFTQRFIPGSNMLGCFAWTYLKTKQVDVEFRRLFLDGSVHFLAAYPENTDQDDMKSRLLPLPHSIRAIKPSPVDTSDAITLRDLAEETTGVVKKEPNSLSRLSNHFARYPDSSATKLETQQIATALNYHHLRASDRRFGRALESVDAGGTLFVYESLCRGQTFQGALLGDETSLKTLKDLLGSQIQVGRSRSAQYGGQAELRWLDNDPVELDERCEWYSWEDNEAKLLDTKPSLLVITCLSPLLAVNDRGHPTARLPLEELKETVGLQAKPKVVGSWTRTELVGGYSGHLNLPRQQWPALAVGSVFVVDLGDDEDISDKRIADLERDGLGLRRHEGFGRIAINRQGWGTFRISGTDLQAINRSGFERPKEEPPTILLQLLAGILQRRTLHQARYWAIVDAQQIECKQIPTGSLLGRLHLVLYQNDCKGATKVIEEFKQEAKDKLEKCRLAQVYISKTPYLKIAGSQPENLEQLLKEWLSEPQTVTEAFLKHLINDSVTGFSSLHEQHEAILERACTPEYAENVVKTFLHNLCAELGRRNRRVNKQAPQQQEVAQ